MGFYEEWILPALIDLSMRNKRLRPYRKRVAGAAEGRVPDVGIGSGLNLPFYAGQVRDVVGLDPSPRLLARAQGTSHGMQLPVRLGCSGRDSARRLLRSADWPSRDQSAIARSTGSARQDVAIRPGANGCRAAKKVGLTFDPPSLVQRILDEAGEDEGILPLLQYSLKETWTRRNGSRLTADSYERSGGVREAIRNTAERTFDALPPTDQQAARQLFLRLVTPGEGQEDTRARAAMPADPSQRKIVEHFASPRT